MSLREEMWKYEHITGESAEHVPIIKLGAFLDGYEMGLKALEQQPCSDCISREALLNSIEEPMNWTDSEAEIQEQKDYENFVALVKSMPSVTPQPKIGKWIEDAKTYYEELNKRGLGVDEYTPYFNDDIACSECLAKYSVVDNETQFFKHCPNCGAKMEE